MAIVLDSDKSVADALHPWAELESGQADIEIAHARKIGDDDSLAVHHRLRSRRT